MMPVGENVTSSMRLLASVVEQLPAFCEETGEFNTLPYACMDWQHQALGQRSMQLLAGPVMPRLNQAIAANAPMRRAA